MDSTDNWGGLERGLRQVSPSWGSNGPLDGGPVNLANFDQSFNFSGLDVAKSRNSDVFTAKSSEQNGLSPESQLMNHLLLSSIRSSVPTQSAAATEEFGHWKPVYDEKSNPGFSLTGTEIWATQKTKNAEEWNSAASYSPRSSLRYGESVIVGNSNGVNDERWEGKSRGGSDAEFVPRLVNRGVDQGWGRTPVCQEKPWELCQDRAILETGSVLPPIGLHDKSNLLELNQDSSSSSLSFLKSILSSGEPLGVLGGHQFRLFERPPQENASKSSGVDAVRLLLELQKLGSLDGAPRGEPDQSRRGSSVSGIDGMPHPCLIGRKDYGFEPQGNAQPWMEKQRQFSLHKDEWNVGSTTRMSSGMQSPSGWDNASGSDKASVVDNGTSVWGKQSVSAAVEDALPWAKLLEAKTVSAFNIDVSIPPPTLNAQSAILRGVAPVPSATPLLGNLHLSSNPSARQPNASLPFGNPCGGRGSVSPDVTEKPWMFQGPQHYSQFQNLGQKTWPGSQWSSMDAWSCMHRRSTGFSQNKVPQTRSKLIQQLVSMGFKKEDVQNALITNNMNLDKAFAELIVKHRGVRTPAAAGSVQHSGRSHQTPGGPRDLMQGPVSGHPRGFSNDAFDFSKLLTGQTEWDSHLSNPAQMISSAGNQSSMPHISPMSPQNIYPPHRPSGLHQNVGHADSVMPGNASFSQGRSGSDFMLWKKPTDDGQGGFHPFDSELLKIFGRQISSDPQNHSEDGAAAYLSKRACLRNPGIAGEGIGVTSAQNGFLSANPPRPDSLYPSVAVDTAARNSFNFDGFESRQLSSAGRRLSVNVMAATDDGSSAVSQNSAAAVSLSSSPGVGLPSALEIKEFIPGVPWKGAPFDASKQGELKTEVVPSSKSPAMVFKDMVKCLAKGNEDAAKEDSIPDCLPSSWVQLRNVSDELDDDALQTLCATYGEVKVFRDEDNSILLSYADPGDAVKAQLALHNSQLKDRQLTAELVDGWTTPTLCGAGTSGQTPQGSVGFMTPNGLWIPPSSDAASRYYGGQDKWYDEAAGEWRRSEPLEALTPAAYEETGDGVGQ